MSVRSLIRQKIVADSAILDLIPADRWHAASSVTDDNRPSPVPFAVMRYGTTSIGMAQAKRSILEVWIHDEPGTYETVDKVLTELARILDGVEHLADEDSEIIHMNWFSNSGDVYDPGFRTIAKTTTFNMITIGV